MVGKVYLVGAGPGDPDLITRKGYKKLLEADCVFTDRLAPDELIEDLPEDTEIVDCGKQPHGHRLNQDEINERLFQKSRAGKQIVRLKGGDPLIFGRGGEEHRYLQERDIPVEIVPGISAANAAASSLGVPLTDREIASEVTFLTGHEAPEKNADSLDWDCMASCRKTLAIYMGVNQLPKIANTLIKNGRDPETPAIAVEKVSQPDQEILTGTLQTLPALARKKELEPPSLILIGEIGQDSLTNQETGNPRVRTGEGVSDSSETADSKSTR
jgi:uroporphyrin-III C-methyltransferase